MNSVSIQSMLLKKGYDMDKNSIKISNIVNLTIHDATPDQIETGVVECEDWNKVKLKELQTPESSQDGASPTCPPEWSDAMISGEPFLRYRLVHVLPNREICSLFAFAYKGDIKIIHPDGTTSTSRHQG